MLVVLSWKELWTISSILPIFDGTKKKQMVQKKGCLNLTIFDLLQNDIGSSLLIVQMIVLYCVTTSIKEPCDVNDSVAIIQQGIGILIFFDRVS